MKKLFFIFTLVLIAFAAVFIAGCQSEEDITGEAPASLCVSSVLNKLQKCNADTFSKKENPICPIAAYESCNIKPEYRYKWECMRYAQLSGTYYFWKMTKEKCGQQDATSAPLACVKAGQTISKNQKCCAELVQVGNLCNTPTLSCAPEGTALGPSAQIKCCENLILFGGKCKSMCNDSDGGRDYNTKGNVTWFGSRYQANWDACRDAPNGGNKASGPYLIEMTCEGQPGNAVGNSYLGTALSAVTYKCPNGCKDGACVDCVKAGSIVYSSDKGCCYGLFLDNNVCNTVPQQKCIDPDEKDYYVKGKTSGYDISTGRYVSIEDSCEGSDTINEYVCDGVYGNETEFKCPNGCKDGACLPEEDAFAEELKLTLALNEQISGKLESSSIGSAEMPKLLENGNFNDEIGLNTNSALYTQTISFSTVDGKGKFVYSRSGYQLLIDGTSEPFYVYALSFAGHIGYDVANPKDDLAGAEITLLGKKYSIDGIEWLVDGMITKLVLTDGKNEYQLQSGDEVFVNGVKIAGTSVSIKGTPGSLTEIDYSYAPVDDEYLSAGESIVDPVFGSFAVKVTSIWSTTENIYANVSIRSI